MDEIEIKLRACDEPVKVNISQSLKHVVAKHIFDENERLGWQSILGTDELESFLKKQAITPSENERIHMLSCIAEEIERAVLKPRLIDLKKENDYGEEEHLVYLLSDKGLFIVLKFLGVTDDRQKMRSKTYYCYCLIGKPYHPRRYSAVLRSICCRYLALEECGNLIPTPFKIGAKSMKINQVMEPINWGYESNHQGADFVATAATNER